MRKVFYPVFIGAIALLYFYPFEPQSNLHRIQASLKSIIDTETRCRNELLEKRQELAKYEFFIENITAQFEKIAANAPICPKTGTQIQVALDDDPRPEYSARCEALRVEIEALEAKLNR